MHEEHLLDYYYKDWTYRFSFAERLMLALKSLVCKVQSIHLEIEMDDGEIWVYKGWLEIKTGKIYITNAKVKK